MTDKSFRTKLILAAIAGIIVVATFVIIDRVAIWKVMIILTRTNLMVDKITRPEKRPKIDKLFENHLWLCVAKDALDSYPVFLVAAGLGPAVLIMLRRRHKTPN